MVDLELKEEQELRKIPGFWLEQFNLRVGNEETEGQEKH